jgi:hypothetical protein
MRVKDQRHRASSNRHITLSGVSYLIGGFQRRSCRNQHTQRLDVTSVGCEVQGGPASLHTSSRQPVEAAVPSSTHHIQRSVFVSPPTLLTAVVAEASAPAFSSTPTAAEHPFSAARCRGVQAFYYNIKVGARTYVP